MKNPTKSNLIDESLREIENSDYEALNKEIYSFINLCMNTPNGISLLPSLSGALKNSASNTSDKNDSLNLTDFIDSPPGLETVDPSLQFLRASFLGNCFAIRRFLENGVDIQYCDKVGRNALHYAVAGGRVSAVKMLIVAGINVDLADCKSWTPLLIGVNKNFKENVEILLKYHADIHAKLKHNLFPCRSVAAVSEPIHFAAIQKNKDITEMLLQNGANINAKDSNNRTPLHYAACRDNKEYLNWIIEKGSIVNSLDLHNRTPLHAAALSGIWENCSILLNKGCSPIQKDIWDLTPLDLANIRGFKEVEKNIKYFLKANNIEFQTKIVLKDLEETVFRILLSGFKERKEIQLKRAVYRLGSLTCLELYHKTMSIEENGGQLTSDETRRKTPGGIFYSLIKEKVKDSTISKQDWEYIRQEEKEKFLKFQNDKTKSKSLTLDKNIKVKPNSSPKHTTTLLVPIIDRIPGNSTNTYYNIPLSYPYKSSNATLLTIPTNNFSSHHLISSPPPLYPVTTIKRFDKQKKKKINT